MFLFQYPQEPEDINAQTEIFSNQNDDFKMINEEYQPLPQQTSIEHETQPLYLHQPSTISTYEKSNSTNNHTNIHTVWLLVKGFIKPKSTILHADMDDDEKEFDNDEVDYTTINFESIKGVKAQISPAHYLNLHKDIQNLTQKIKTTQGHCIYKTIQPNNNDNLALEINRACEYTSECGANRFMIYYTGHGQTNKGDWKLNAKYNKYSYMTLQNLFESLFVFRNNAKIKQIHILSDCCDSYKWVDDLCNYHSDSYIQYLNKSVYIYASACNQPNAQIISEDNKFSKWLCGKTDKGVCYYHAIHPKRLWTNSVMRDYDDYDRELWGNFNDGDPRKQIFG